MVAVSRLEELCRELGREPGLTRETDTRHDSCEGSCRTT